MNTLRNICMLDTISSSSRSQKASRSKIVSTPIANVATQKQKYGKLDSHELKKTVEAKTILCNCRVGFRPRKY